MARRRTRVPEVLLRLFGDNARTLADTILALIPPRPATATGCRCKGRRCLSCSGDEAMSFLVRPGDPSDYRKLLTGCFAVVSENAPPLPVFDPHCRWPQREIVRRSIEMIMYKAHPSSNLICCSYDKYERSSAVVDSLTSSIWTVLLKRVGDSLMMYLLRYTSLFLPLPRNKHHQITGFPISDLCKKPSQCMPNSKVQHHPVENNGSRLKRKRVERIQSIQGLQPSTYSLDSQPSSNNVRSVVSKGSSSVSEELSDRKREGRTDQNTITSHKRKREYLWKRERKRRQLVVRGTNSSISCRRNSDNTEILSPELQSGICTSSSQIDRSNICHCFCCSVFQNEPKMKGNAEIDRKSIFYKLENFTSMFPRKHILYTLRSNSSGASILFNNIFEKFGMDKNPGTTPCLRRKSSCPVTSTCLYHSLIKLLKSLIHKTRNCPYLRLLDKHCPIRSSYQDERKGAGAGFEGNDPRTNLCLSGQGDTQIKGELSRLAKDKSCKIISDDTVDQVEPSKLYCPKKNVVSFIWAICRRIVPLPLLGEPYNWRILRKNISKFIQLRKFENLTLKESIHKLKISKFPLLSNKHLRDAHNGCGELGVTDVARHAILECWIFWFFASIVSPLLQANFYVTDSEHEKKEVLYYRKSTWKELIRESDCVKDERYRLLDLESVREILGNRSFGFSKARLLPKQIGFRMLTNLRSSSRIPLVSSSSKTLTNLNLQSRRVTYRSSDSVNKVLHDLHVVVKGLLTKEPKQLGSSVFDYNDIYRKLVPFLYLLKNGLPKPRVFIVVSDVSKAFDSVNQDKLLSVMKDVILDDEYTLEELTQVFCTEKSLNVHQHLTLANQDFTAPGKMTSRLPLQLVESILVKKALSRKIQKEDINLTLEEHIMGNVVKLDKNFYLQLVGIPQGSVLSSLLCSLYYGHMERNVLYPFIEKASENNTDASASGGNNNKRMFACGSEHVLLRFIDDFLFISTSKRQASMFLSRLERGFRDYNCYMNEEKYGLNFNMNDWQGCRSNRRLHVGKDGASFLRWSGLLINCSSLEIQADYRRYLNVHLSSTLTVKCRGKVGRQLKSKLRFYMRPKCHPIFYDSNINSPGVVRLNMYQAFLLCAMKFVCYTSNLSILPKFRPEFYINSIEDSLRYMTKLIKRKMYSFKVDDTAFRPKYDVKKEEIIWLGLYAYSRVLEKKQSRYRDLLHLFRSKLKAYGKIDDVSPDLKYAVDDAHSTVLWSIKY